MNQKNTSHVEKGLLLAQHKGITLISLVITIIVLLILVGVTINMVLGDDGIIAQAQKAEKEQKDAEEKDSISIAIVEAKTSEYMGVMTEAEVEAKLGDVFDDDTLYNNSIREIIEFNGKYLPIPKGMAYAFGTIEEGAVVVDGYGNEFVWVPVETFSDLAVLKSASTTDYWGQLWAINPYVVFGTKKTSYSEIMGMREPSLVSFSVDTNSDTNSDKNEANIEAILEEEYINESGEYTSEGLLRQYQDEYNSMAESVKIYKGFYVGRYETSWTGNRVASISNVEPMTNFTDLSSVEWECANDLSDSYPNMTIGSLATWYGLYKKQKELHAESDSIVSGMIYGSQWDAIMNWMKEIDNPNVEGTKFIKNSVGMGWYSDNYEAGNPTHLTGIELNKGMNKTKNIYDLAGNYREFTQEAFDALRVARGGGTHKTGDASHNMASGRGGDRPDCIEEGISSYNTSRLQLYIK